MYQGKYETNKSSTPVEVQETKKPRKGTIVFYSCYVAFILIFVIGIFCLLGPLDQWLAEFEASQPGTKCQTVFDTHFANRDWATLYTLAGIEDTDYEGRDDFVTFMDDTYGDAQLSYSETSAGLSGDKKYIVRAGDDKIATFTLTNKQPDAPIPDWQLGNVELFFQRKANAHIIIRSNCTAYVNGIPLTEDNVIRKTATLAEKYLPEGVHGLQTMELYVDGLLNAPSIIAKDADGKEIKLTYDEKSNTYYDGSVVPQEAPQELYDRALECAEAISRYMIEDIRYKNQLKAILGEGKVTDVVAGGERFVNKWSSFEFKNESCSDYYRYTDTLFSIHVKTETHIQVISFGGSTRIIEQDLTLFFTRDKDGRWIASDMTNFNVQDLTEEVRLTFVQDSDVLDSQFVNTSDKKFVAPMPTVPEGKVFAGWCKQVVTEEGTTWSLVFPATEDGTVDLTTVEDLEPMTLYPLFENKEAK